MTRLLATAEPAVWPDGTAAQIREDVFGLRLRVIREFEGDKAAEKFLRAAFENNPTPEVKAYMAWVCFFGKGWGMPSLLDPARGEQLALEAAAAGSAVATDVYGRALGQQLVPDKPASLSLVWLKKAAAMEVPRAMARLGFYQAIGFGLTANPAEGIKLARRAAELGYPDGLVDIANAYEQARIPGGPHPNRVLELYAEAALHREATAWTRLKELAMNSPRANLALQTARVHEANNAAWMLPRKARGLVEELEKIAGDDPAALAELGEASLIGYYAKRDYVLAKQRFERATRQGNADAQFYLAQMRLRGLAGPKEPAAIEEIRELGDQGNVRAAAYLGWVHYWGVSEAPDCRKDEAIAFRYVRQAAERGDVWSVVNLAFCYEHGIGTPENYALAAKMYWQAFLRGYKPGLDKARRALNFVEK